ncbi:MAG TPA: hypothetical protein VJZ49_03170 [Syntrophales bacterium]|nr:hypothetical protein [Syntrophales bacterium]
MDIMTYLVFEDFFNQIEKSGLALPLSCLGDKRVIDEIIDELISGLDPIETISYSSFLNMIVQHCEPEESAQLGRKELTVVGFGKDIPGNKVFFHRDCLLHMMSLIIAGCKGGATRITGGNDRRGTTKYYKALLLINSKINAVGENTKYTLLKNYIIRDYPISYSPKATHTIYSIRLQRYWYIYSQILPKMGTHKAKIISKGIHALENDSGLTLQEHYLVLAGILDWFLILPAKRRERQSEATSSLGFDHRNINSFYIRKNNFPDTDRLIYLIKFIARDINCLREHFARDRRDEVSGSYRNLRDFFDQPIFKIDDDNFCILDLKFLIEGLCSGFLWRIKDKASLQNIHQGLKGYYGQLLEKYFVFLLEQIFGHTKISKAIDSGPDSIVETKDYLIIFEFTTEYYRFASLYNESTDFFVKDLKRLLFNRGKDDPDGRNKKDKGKFLKLNEYLNTSAKQEKKIIPILVTENYLGDYELLNQFDNVLDKEIQKYGLTNIQKHKPLILCLDDLEIFWALSNEDNAVQELETSFQTWGTSDKGKFLYNFSYFISSRSDAIIRNDKYLDFFDYSKFWNELAE